MSDCGYSERRIGLGISLIAGVFAIVGGTLAVFGWATGHPSLADWRNDGIVMQPNTGAAAAISGVAMISVAIWRPLAVRILGLMVAALGFANLFQHATHLDLGIDTVLMFDQPWGRTATLAPGRMGPPASICWTLVGTAFIALSGQRYRWVASRLGFFVLVIAGLPLIGYFFGADRLYALPRLTAIAFPTASILLALGMGLVTAAFEQEPMRTLLAPSGAGALARRALPFVIVLPVLLGLIALSGERAGLYDSSMGAALLVLALILIQCGVLWWVVESVRIREESLADSERRFKTLTSHAPVGIFQADADGNCLFVNERWCELAGQSPEQARGQGWSHALHVDDRERVSREWYASSKWGLSFSSEYRFQNAQGEVAWLSGSAVPLRDETGSVIGHIGTITDITARRRAEEKLRESEERYRRLADLLPVAVYTCEAPGGTITYFNNQAVHLWGRAPKIGDPTERYCGSFKLLAPDGAVLPHDQCPMAVALIQNQRFRNEEVLVERPDGSRITVLVNIDPIQDASGHVVAAINVFHDVTTLKQAEQALREQKENLQTLLDTLPVAVLIAHDRECRRISGNRAAVELMRVTSGANFSTAGPPDERPTHFKIFKAGRPLPPEALPVPRAARGEVVVGEEVDHAFEDGTIRHSLISAKPLFDPDGRPRGAVACILDITELKAAERALKEADVRKDRFLATLAHELRNPLAPIRNALEIIRRVDGDRDFLLQLRDTIERQVNQLVRLVDDLLDVSRITRDRLELRKSRVAVRTVLEQAIEASRPLAEREEQSIEVTLPDQAFELHADPVRLTQVFTNLLNNACKFTPRQGTITVRAKREADDIVISITDNGIGIPRENLDNIFDMFSQVDTAVERSRGGLGIGLTLVKRLVEMHGGSITAASDGLGHGSQFVVRLPIYQEVVGDNGHVHGGFLRDCESSLPR
jgi:PAS domain S-box-containing protein